LLLKKPQPVDNHQCKGTEASVHGPASGGVRRRKERRARPAIDSLAGRAVLFAAALED